MGSSVYPLQVEARSCESSEFGTPSPRVAFNKSLQVASRHGRKKMKVTTGSPEYGLPSLGGAKTTASVWFNGQVKASRLGEWTMHRLLLGQEQSSWDLGRYLSFPPAFSLLMLASEIWSQQASLAILHDYSHAPCSRVWGDRS